MDKKKSVLKLSEESAATPEKEKNELRICPKCGYQAKSPDDPIIVKHDGLGECPSCGIIVAKYIEKQKDELAARETPSREPEKTDDSSEEYPSIDDDYIID